MEIIILLGLNIGLIDLKIDSASQKRNHKKALECYNKVIEIDPNHK